MLKSLVLVLCAIAVTVSAADIAGVWKLNPAKSKYTGTAGNKEMTVTYTMQGSGWTYSAKGVSAAGEPITRSYTYVKDGEEFKVTGFPNWDGLVLKNAATSKSTSTYMRGGKAVGTGTRTISADGKTMTIRSTVTLPDGKKATMLSVYDRQ
ncbi:MAG: hypothetical protein ACKV2U_23650 [Bryobacteraceae bacterium]